MWGSLAWAELRIALATFVRKLGMRMELFETGPEEVEYKCELLLILPDTAMRQVSNRSFR